MSLIVWAEFSLTHISTWSLPVRICAIGAALAVGAIGAGLLVQILTKSVAKQTAPGPAVNLVRVGGGLTSGLAAFLYLIGTGDGPGGGGPGGDEPGPGSQRVSTENGKDPSKPDKKKPDSTETPKEKETPQLRVEILSYQVLNSSDVQEKRFFRMNTSDGGKMVSLEELVDFISKHEPYPTVVILEDYEDSADTDLLRAIKEMKKLAKDLNKNPDEWVKSEPKARKSPRP